MITSKHARCQRFCWAYISKYPHVLTSELVGSTTDYGEHEVYAALLALERLGYVARDPGQIARGWVALVPFVVSVPAWAK